MTYFKLLEHLRNQVIILSLNSQSASLEYWNFRLDENGNEIDVEGLFDPDTDGMYPPKPNTDATESFTFEES